MRCRTCPANLATCNRHGFCTCCSRKLMCRICARPTRFKRKGFCLACDDVIQRVARVHEGDRELREKGERVRVYETRARRGLPLFEDG